MTARLLRPFLRRWLELPRARFAVERADEWMPAADGTRLATRLVRPAGSAALPASAVLVRTPRPADETLLRTAAELVAESGRVAVIQSCRGRGGSEGHFAAFDEQGDGADAVAWVARQPWCDGRIVLAGSGYAGHAAWAALAAGSEAVQGAVIAFAAREPHAWLYVGGALQLELALALGTSLSDADAASNGAPAADLERAVRHRPLRDADRVALRRCDAYREWLEHPEPDAFWDSRTPPLPTAPPPVLQIAGWHHPALASQLREHHTLRESGGAGELLVGPWGVGRVARAERAAGARLGPSVACAVEEFLARRLGGAERRPAAVRIFMRGTRRWREAESWPPAATAERLYLRGAGQANGGEGDGRLAREAPADDECADAFVYDPAAAVPSEGGATLATPGPRSCASVEERGDVLCYTTDPLPKDLTLAGPVRVVLFASSDAACTDFTARLVEVDAAGHGVGICDGIRRGSVSPTEPIEVSAGATGCRVRAGHRLRLEISSSSFPRFDRNPNTGASAAAATAATSRLARQSVFHDRKRPSHLWLSVAGP